MGSESILSKIRERVYGAWLVLTGKAYAAYYVNMPTSLWMSTVETHDIQMSEPSDPTNFGVK